MNNYDDLFTANGEKKESKTERPFDKEEWAAKKQQERLNLQKAIRESKWKDTPIRSLEYRFLVRQVHVIAGSSL